MTPYDKAKELVEKYYEYSQDVGDINYSSKQCAIICCDEIIESLRQSQKMSVSSGEYMYQFEYWQSVKREIEKL